MTVPLLRFKSYTDDWLIQPIGKVLTIGSGKDYKHLDSGDVPVYGTGGLMTKVNDYLYDGETVCIGRKGTIDKPMYLRGKIWTVDTLFYTHSFKSVTPRFLYNLFQRINWKQHNEAGGVPSLSKSTIEKILLTFPSMQEQSKIADFLSAIDEKITQESKKHELIICYKKGVTQQIFSQDVRFKGDDGKSFPDWDEKTIDDVADVTTGDKDTQNKIEDGAYPFFVRSQNVERINSFSIEGEAILTSGDGVGVGKNYHYINGRFDFHQRVYCLHNFKKGINGKFVFHYFSQHFNKRVMQLSAKNSVDSVRRSMITDMPISIPTYQEQTKIADFLTAIDEKITSSELQLEALKQYKQGLLQKMFV